MIDHAQFDSLSRRVRDLEGEIVQALRRITEVENKQNGKAPLGRSRNLPQKVLSTESGEKAGR